VVRDPATGRVLVLEDEESWLSWVEDRAARSGWRYYHTRRSTGSVAGFPDLCLVRGPRLIFAELKTDHPRSQLSAAQRDWLDDLDVVAGGRRRRKNGYPVPETYVWRPRDRDLITAVLA